MDLNILKGNVFLKRTIQLLNKKGYETKCCSGHNVDKCKIVINGIKTTLLTPRVYILFKKDYNIPKHYSADFFYCGTLMGINKKACRKAYRYVQKLSDLKIWGR